MNKEHTKTLFNDFPELYRGKDKSVTENLMSFGFECGDGWFDLIYQLSKRIDEIAKKSNLEGDDYPLAFQVKEKFGELRFYINGANEEIHKAIEEATLKSTETCQICGKPGKRRSKGYWISTQCDHCHS